MKHFIKIKSNRIRLTEDLVNFKSDLIKIKVKKKNKNGSFISRINKERRNFIPKNVREDLGITYNDKVDIEIEEIKKEKRKKNLIKKGRFISLALIPKKTLSNREIFIIESNGKLLTGYFTFGGPRYIEINKDMPIEFSKCLGYYQAEGGKNKLNKGRGRAFSFTNTSLKIIKDFLYLVDYFVDKGLLNSTIYFNEKINKGVLDKIKKELMVAGIKKEKIKFYKAEGLRKYSIQLWITNSLLADIFNNVVNKTRKLLIEKDKPSIPYLFFLRGLLAGDGLLTKNRDKLGSLHSKLYFYEGDKKLVRDYKKLLDKIDLKGKIKKDKTKNMYTLIININWNRLLQIAEFGLLEEKPKDKEKLIWLIKNHKRYKSLKYFKDLPKRLNIKILIRIIDKEKVVIYNWIRKRIIEGLIEKEDINKWVITREGMNIKNILNNIIV